MSLTKRGRRPGISLLTVLSLYLVDGFPPVAIELEQLDWGEPPAVRTGLVVDLIGNLVSNLGGAVDQLRGPEDLHPPLNLGVQPLDD